MRSLAGMVLSAGLLLGQASAPAEGRTPERDAPRAAPGWTYRVIAQRLTGVDNLAIGRNGALYASLERAQGEGSVVRVREDGVDTVLGGLDRADGLAAHNGLLYVTEEVARGRIIVFDPDAGTRNAGMKVLARMERPEGIGFLPDGALVLSEDKVGGRVLRLSRDGRLEALSGKLLRPEGLSISKDGKIAVAETLTGRVLIIHPDGRMTRLVSGLENPDQVAWAPDGSLWITEDADPGRLLRFVHNRLEIIVSGLRYPQGMVFISNEHLYLAEQGRQRILELERVMPAS